MKRLQSLKKKHIIIGAIVLIVLIIIVISSAGGSNTSSDVAIAKVADLIERVSVTGRVAPWKKADLAFEKPGTLVVKVLKVGDKVSAGGLIAALDTGEPSASLQGAQANLASEQAKLAELQKGLRPEEAVVENTKVSSAQVAYETARADAVNSIRSAYSKIDSAIKNQTDSFFSNAQTANPIISLRTESTVMGDKVNASRLYAGEQLVKWKKEIDAVDTTSDASVGALIASSQIHMGAAKDLLSQLIIIVNAISTANSGLSATVIDGYLTAVNTAYADYTTAATSVTNAESGFKSASSSLALAKNQFSLKSAGASPEAIEAQIARVEQASANVASLASTLTKSKIVSPFDGIVTKADPEIGEYVAAGSSGFAVMSDESFKIEVNVPEVDIAKISVGNKASVTLDAYDDTVVFPATVTLIDPAETYVEGLPTYKVTLQFDIKDPRIRSGMTANIDLITNTRSGVVVVPARAVHFSKGTYVVRILGSDTSDIASAEEREVTIGLKGSDGNIEIVSGLKVGEKVATSLK